MLGFFLKVLFPRLKWIITIGGLVKVHSAPLLGGAGVGLAFLVLQEKEVLTIDLSFLLNQTLLDSFCTAYGVCLTVAQGASTISSTLLAVVTCTAFEKMYRRNKDKKIAQEIEAGADKITGALGIPDTADETPDEGEKK